MRAGNAIVAIALLCGFSAARADELAERQRALSVATALYRGEAWVQLDTLFDKAQREQLRTPSGLWISGLLNGGIDEAEPLPRDEAQWQEQWQRAQRWATQRPDSLQARMNLAATAFAHAQALGCGHCTVLDESQRPKLYRAAIAEARRLYEAAHAAGAKDPEYYARLVDLAQMDGQPSSALDPVLARIGAEAPGYYPAWFEAVDFYLKSDPAHAGARIEALARRATAASRRSDGRSMYARIWWYAAQQGYGSRLFQSTPVQWADFDAGFKDILARYAEPWNRNSYASFACQAGHPERARELMQGQEPLPQAWDSFEQYQNCVQPVPTQKA